MRRKSLVFGSVPGLLALLTGLSTGHSVGTQRVSALAPAGCAPLRVPTRSRLAPRIRGRFGQSTNWAGYAVTGPTNSVQKVTGSWTVPPVQPVANCPNNTYSAVWIGIDGDNSSTVEQCGTEQNWLNGSPVYSAWYEMYPKFPVTITANVQPGDSIQATVQSVGSGRFQLIMTDTRLQNGQPVQVWSLNTTQQLKSAKRTSAEWIAEAPYSGGVLPLADFTSVAFDNCTATVGTQSLPLQSWVTNGNFDQINMVNSSGGIKALTNSPSSTTGFSIDWRSCQ